MSENYVEYLVKQKANVGITVLKYIAYVLTGIFLLFGLFFTTDLGALLMGVVFGVLSYFLNLNASVEYEYLFLGKELSVDRIQAQSNRKKMKEFDLTKVELVAPAKSHRLDSYNQNKKCVSYDFSSKEEEIVAYSFIYADDNELAKVTIDMTEDILKCFKNISPRKVFTD